MYVKREKSKQGTLKFKISLREVYSEPGSLRVMKNIIKVFHEDFTTLSDPLTY